MISKEEVRHIAGLARIGVDENEVENVLDAVEKLAETQNDLISRMSSFMNVANKQE